MGVLSGAGRWDRLVGGDLVEFSFPIKFGWCSVWGKNEKLIFRWSWVRVDGGRKIDQKEGISEKNRRRAANWGGGGRRRGDPYKG